MAKTTNNKAKKKSSDIPLENIPERTTRKAYTAEFKKAAAERVIAGEVGDVVARELGIPSSSVLHGWVAKVRAGQTLSEHGGARVPKIAADNAASMLRHALANATKARDERLEAAATIVEIDGNSPDIAKKIRALKRQT